MACCKARHWIACLLRREDPLSSFRPYAAAKAHDETLSGASPKTLMRAALTVLMLATTSAVAQTADDVQMLRKLGYVAGQAVACDIEQPDVAAQVANAMADAMGFSDEASHRLLASQTLSAAAGPCEAPANRLDEIRSNWRARKRRAGLG